jgi:hypothetical protein
MLLIFIWVKQTFLLFFFDLILNLATNKQKKWNNKERMSEQKASEQRTSEQKASEQKNERTIETSERDYKRMQL